jgi:UDP-2,3-diacylglucosamine pyrophosphatase LpxH
MKKVAIFMSDFHLGQKDRMEEFHADQEFAELLERRSKEHADHEVDLVLLGDVMDLWTTITDKREINAKSAAEVDLYFPVTPATRKAALEKELAKVISITSAHPEFFAALRRFLSDVPTLRRILYIPGNHDHSVVAQEIQKKIRDTIVGQDLQLNSRIEFPNWYDDEFLQVYAEHGNQLTFGGAYRYDDFGTFGQECPGYYALKLVWNRLERKSPEADNVFMGALSPATWPGLSWWLLAQGNLRNWKILRTYTTQYEQDPRATKARSQMPKPRQTVAHLMKSKGSVTGDEFWDQVPQLFDPNGQGVAPLRGRRLDPHETKTLVLGHSHHAKDKDLPDLHGVKYYNTGSWIFHLENGRRIVEQTWLTISRDRGAGGRGVTGHPEPDRKLSLHRIELPRSEFSLLKTTSTIPNRGG